MTATDACMAILLVVGFLTFLVGWNFAASSIFLNEQRGWMGISIVGFVLMAAALAYFLGWWRP